MKEVILIRFGEIFLKGKNYMFFENTLFKNIQRRLRGFNLKLTRTEGRFIVENFNLDDKQQIISSIKNIFGVVSISIAREIESNINRIVDAIKNIKINNQTFKVEVKTYCPYPIHCESGIFFVAICQKVMLLSKSIFFEEVKLPKGLPCSLKLISLIKSLSFKTLFVSI